MDRTSAIELVKVQENMPKGLGKLTSIDFVVKNKRGKIKDYHIISLDKKRYYIGNIFNYGL
jgi:hypothetical protein